MVSGLGRGRCVVEILDMSPSEPRGFARDAVVQPLAILVTLAGGIFFAFEALCWTWASSCSRWRRDTPLCAPGVNVARTP